MDLHIWRSIVTLLAFLCFVGIVIWAWSRGARKGFEEAAQLPFNEDDEFAAAATSSIRGNTP